MLLLEGKKSLGKLCVVHMLEIIHSCLTIHSAHFSTCLLPGKPRCITYINRAPRPLSWVGSNNVEHHQKLKKEIVKSEVMVFITLTFSACLPWAVCYLPTKFMDPFNMDDPMQLSLLSLVLLTVFPVILWSYLVAFRITPRLSCIK